MKIHTDIAQGSVEWGILRSGKVTASEMNQLVSDTGKVRTGDMPRSYLNRKLSEEWQGGPLPELNVWDLEQGKLLEEQARPAFEVETGLTVTEVAFIEGDNPRIGCSPDGLIGDNCGVEIKCPRIQTHVGYLLSEVVPPEYVVQVQASLYVTKFPSWFFFSYRRRMAPLVVEVKPNDQFQDAIHEAVTAFLEKFEWGFQKLIEKHNGVRPQRNLEMHFSKAPADDNQIHDDLV